jgi:hypothetical protein
VSRNGVTQILLLHYTQALLTQMAHTAVCNRHHAGKLQRLGVIEYSRGRITVLDRRKLEQLCCECYAVVKKESDRLLADPG